MTTTTIPYVRWLIRRDLPEVLDLEQDLSREPWSEAQWLSHIRTRCTIGHVAEDARGRIIGAMLYTLDNSGLVIERIISRTTPAADAMVHQLLDKLSPQRRTWLETHVPESDLPAQLFFQRHGFVCVGIERGETGENAYRFRFSLPL